MKIKLTQSLINTYKIPQEIKARQQELVDQGGTGLYLLVTKGGSKTFYLRYKSPITGKTTHKKLDRATDTTLAQARDKVKLLRAEIALGNDPQAQVKQKRNELTYHEFITEHYLPYITPRRRSARNYHEMYNLRIKAALGDTKLNQLSRRQIQEFHSNLPKQGLSKSFANRHLAMIKSSINVGINIMEVIDIKNPAVGIPMFEEHGRERYLDSDELARLMPVLVEDDSQIARIIRFLLATGLRLGECLNCRWEHVNIEQRVMKIPGTQAKSKKTDSIPLNAAAIEVLSECSKDFPYPFVNLSTGKPYVSIKKRFHRLMEEAKLENVTAHVLRHTAASIMINSGRSLYDVQRVLRHSSSIVTEKYSHLSSDSVMAASDTISDQLFKAASGHQ